GTKSSSLCDQTLSQWRGRRSAPALEGRHHGLEVQPLVLEVVPYRVVRQDSIAPEHFHLGTKRDHRQRPSLDPAHPQSHTGQALSHRGGDVLVPAPACIHKRDHLHYLGPAGLAYEGKTDFERSDQPVVPYQCILPIPPHAEAAPYANLLQG